jgi:hypothetical protein
MKAYMVVRIEGFQRVVLQMVLRFTGQDIKMCRSMEDVKEGLA